MWFYGLGEQRWAMSLVLDSTLYALRGVFYISSGWLSTTRRLNSLSTQPASSWRPPPQLYQDQRPSRGRGVGVEAGSGIKWLTSSIISLQRQIKFPFLCIMVSFWGRAKITSLSDAVGSVFSDRCMFMPFPFSLLLPLPSGNLGCSFPE